jgi:hypothetical protein
VGRTDPRARSLGLFVSRLDGAWLAFGGFRGNAIPAAVLREAEPENADIQKLAAKAGKDGLLEWDKADEAAWQAWFRHLAERGATALRLLPYRRPGGDVLDLCGAINKPLLDLMKRFVAAAKPFGIRFLLVAMPNPADTAYVKKANLKYVLPAFGKKSTARLPAEQKRFVVKQQTVSMTDYFTDPDVWACQRRYLDALLDWVEKEPQIFALEVVHEQGWWDEKFHWDQEEAIEAWGSRVIEYVHARMRDLPVGISHPPFGILGYEPLRWARETSMDFYSPHFGCGAGDRRGIDLGLAAEIATNYASTARPVLIGEWGIRNSKIEGRLQQLALRDAIWFSVLNGCPGLLLGEGAAHYDEEFKKARDILEPLNLHRLDRQRPLVGIDISRAAQALAANGLYESRKALDPQKLVAKKAGGDAYLELARCTEFFLNHGVSFDFTLTPEEYSIAADPARLESITVPSSECLFAFSPIYQCKYTAFGDWQTIVAYFRNVQPVVAQGCNLRAQTPRPFQAAWQLPKRPRGASGGAWHYRLTVRNLDTGEMRQNRVARESSVDFGNQATADYVFIFER